MYTNRLEEFVIPVKSSFECLTVGDKSTGVLDVILTANKEKSRYVCAVVNKDPEQNRTLTLDFEGMGIKAPRNVSAVVLSGKLRMIITKWVMRIESFPRRKRWL